MIRSVTVLFSKKKKKRKKKKTKPIERVVGNLSYLNGLKQTN